MTEGQYNVKANPYIGAARCLGASDLCIIQRHVLPNVLAPLICVEPKSTFGTAPFLSWLQGLPNLAGRAIVTATSR